MLHISTDKHRLCQGPSRRDFLRVGALTALGLSLPDLLRITVETDESRSVEYTAGAPVSSGVLSKIRNPAPPNEPPVVSEKRFPVT